MSERFKHDGPFVAEAVPELISAVYGARFVLHCALLGYTAREDYEGIECAGEALAELQAALVKVCAPNEPQPICSGCSPIAPFETAPTKAAA